MDYYFLYIIIAVIILSIIFSANGETSTTNRRNYRKPVNLWYGTLENGECYIDLRKYIVYSTLDKCPREWKEKAEFIAVAP